MGYAESVIRQILNEDITQGNVSQAVKKRHVVSFKYDNGDGTNRGKLERVTVCPCVLGVTSKGNLVFRGYQMNGSSKSAEEGKRPLPGWRMFRLDRVVPNTWKDTRRVFNRPPDYNEEGDKGIQVLVQSNFTRAKTTYERGGLKGWNQRIRMAKDYEYGDQYGLAKQVQKPTMAPEFVRQNIERPQTSGYQTDQLQADYQKALAAQQKRGYWNGSQSSVKDMAGQALKGDFGDDTSQETVGPVQKGEQTRQDVRGTVKPRMDYKSARQNGPQFRKSEEDNDENEETE